MDFDRERHKEIKARLKKAGCSLKDIADALNVSQSFITKVSQGWNTSKRAEAEIARRLAVHPQEIWPSRYPNKEDA